MHKKYNRDKDVLQAARERISYIFDNFEEIQVSVSGGKDSTVLLHLVLQEAQIRQRFVEVFFLDQEAEYKATIDLMRKQMSMPFVIPKWYQIPIYMTNATSYNDYFLYAWGENEKWIRNKEDIAIQEIKEDYPKRFYEFFPYLEKKKTNKAYLIGLRADESMNRYRAVTKYSGYNGLKWSTKTTHGANRFYPIYDMTFSDIWRFIYDYGIEYNRIYDYMFWDNHSIFNMRVSNLIHEKSYHCLKDLAKFEPETYDNLCQRISGIATAARYASERVMFSSKELPKHYKCWKDFRDFLLENIPNSEHKATFKSRFEKQEKNERTYKAQVKQLLIMDFENSTAFDTKKELRTNQLKEKWNQIL